MIVIPAIDLLNGRCVRLKQGKENESTVYDKDPEQMALEFEEQGADYLHVVNLDGAFGRENKNVKTIESILKNVSIPVELGGGIRRYEDACKWITLGISRIIVGTIAVTHPLIVRQLVDSFGPERLVAAMDVSQGKVMIKGWTQDSDLGPAELAQQFRNLGIKRIIYTDIARDGTLKGPNLKDVDQFAKSVQMPTVASGGFSELDHFRQLLQLKNEFIEGAIIGKALYENKIELEQIVELIG